MEKYSQEDIDKIISNTYGCVIKQNINIVWDFIKDVDQHQVILGDIRSPVEYTKGTKSWEVGTEYNFTWSNYRRIYSKIEEVIDEDNYKQIKYHIKLEPLETEYEFIYNFYKISVDDSTCLKWKVIYGEGKGVTMKKKQMEMWSEERAVMMKRFEEHLNNLNPHFKQMESFIYECKLKDIWKIITNWKIFQKLVPEICDEIIFTESNDTFIVIWNKTHKIYSSMKILQHEYNESENKFEYKLLCFNNPPEIPDQELHFKFININNRKCMLEYKHVFLTYVSQESLEKVSIGKRKILMKLNEAILLLKKKKLEGECNKKTSLNFNSTLKN